MIVNLSISLLMLKEKKVNMIQIQILMMLANILINIH